MRNPFAFKYHVPTISAPVSARLVVLVSIEATNSTEVYRKRASSLVSERGGIGDVGGSDRSGYTALAVIGGGRLVPRPSPGRNSGGIAATRAGRPTTRKKRGLPAWIRPAGPVPGGVRGGGTARPGTRAGSA